jgi:hypothetical protein
MPTGGVDATWESISSWIKAGTAAVGMGSKLITKESVAVNDFEAIQRRVEECIWWVKKARGQPLLRGVEHVGLHATKAATAAEIADW